MTEEQKENINRITQEFLDSNVLPNQGEQLEYAQFDEKRNSAIHEALRPFVEKFLQEEIDLTEFKETSEVLCREYPLWGFKGFSGQMQLNQFVNNIDDPKRVSVLCEAITFPESKEAAIEKIDNMAQYLRQKKDVADNPKGIPRVNQAFLLSYFWEIQKPEAWPVYFSSSKKVLEKMGFDLNKKETSGENYIDFVETMQSIQSHISDSQYMDKQHPVWFVEHILWNHFISQGTKQKVEKKKEKVEIPQNAIKTITEEGTEWVPPIVSDLPDVASNKETEWTRAHNMKPEHAFEMKLQYAFTLLGYMVEELGQGKGREPDGVATSIGVESGDYAIVFDAKAREDGYSLGTQDREIVEYITNKSSELKKNRIHKLYFIVISSQFKNPEKIKTTLLEMYKKTQKPIALLSADDLLFILEEKLKNAELDHNHLEDLFLENGLITRDKIAEILGVR